MADDPHSNSREHELNYPTCSSGCGRSKRPWPRRAISIRPRSPDRIARARRHRVTVRLFRCRNAILSTNWF